MSVRAMSWAWDQPVGGNQKLVLLRLADHANDEGLCWPSQDTMHVKCGIGERTVRDCLSALEGCGLISRRPRWRSGRRTTDLILLIMQAADSAGSNRGETRPLLPADNAGSKPATVAGSESAESAGSQPADSSKNNRRDLPGNPKKEPPRTEPEKKALAELSSRRELVELSNRLAAGIRKNDAKAKVNPTSHTWLDPLRLLLDCDERTVEEIEAVIDWCLADDFNRETVLSPRKLRSRFQELVLKAGVNQSVPDPIDFRRRPSKQPQTQAVACDSWADEHPATPELAAEWAPIAKNIAGRVGDSYNIWLAPLHLHASSSEEFVLGHPKAEAIGWISDRYGRILTSAAGRPIRIVHCDCEQAEQAA